MPGLVPAPAIPTRLRIGTSDTYQSGDITLVPGAALYGSRSGKSLQFDGVNADPVAPSGLFIPGALAAVTAACQFRQTSSSGETFLQLIEANLKTAPSGVDATNNLAIRVRGQYQGSLDLPMLSASRHFTLAGTDGAILGTQPGTGSPPANNGGRRTYFKPTANMTVTSIALGQRESLHPLLGVPKTYYLWDQAGNILGQTYSYYGKCSASADNALDTYRPLKKAVTLTNNVTYIVGCILEDGGANSAQWAGPDGTHTGNVVSTGFVTDAYNGATWSNFTSGSMTFGLGGSPGGTLLIGDVFVDIVTNGTGGTTPGADLNLRLAFGVAS